MTRRQVLALFGVSATPAIGAAPAGGALPPFWKGRLSDVDEAAGRLEKGQARVIGRSAGGRPIRLVTFGEAEPLGGTANYNSACGGNDPASYARKDGRLRPVVFLLGPVHGNELEGVVGLVNLIRIAETGADLRGRPWPVLAEALAQCRVLIVPSGNPDGRARCPAESWVGADLATVERIGMGTRPDGSSYSWPSVKRIHPMRGSAVGTLGTYFNDVGVNLMHDEWSDPMASETNAFLKLARTEAPDFIVSLHSHASHPSIEPTAYVPRTVKVLIQQLADRLYRRYAEAGLPHRPAGPEPREDGVELPPPSFNLCSALHHACGGVAFVHECTVGVNTPPYPRVTHDQILDLELLLFEELFLFAREHPTRWTRPS